MSRRLTIMLFACFGFCITILCAIYFIDLNQFKSRIESEFNSTYPAHLKIKGRLHFDFSLTPTLAADDIYIYDSTNTEQLAYLQKAQIKVGLLPPVIKKIIINDSSVYKTDISKLELTNPLSEGEQLLTIEIKLGKEELKFTSPFKLADNSIEFPNIVSTGFGHNINGQVKINYRSQLVIIGAELMIPQLDVDKLIASLPERSSTTKKNEVNIVEPFIAILNSTMIDLKINTKQLSYQQYVMHDLYFSAHAKQSALEIKLTEKMESSAFQSNLKVKLIDKALKLTSKLVLDDFDLAKHMKDQAKAIKGSLNAELTLTSQGTTQSSLL